MTESHRQCYPMPHFFEPPFTSILEWQFPDELVTYGGNGSVFSNWAQYHLTMMVPYTTTC